MGFIYGYYFLGGIITGSWIFLGFFAGSVNVTDVFEGFGFVVFRTGFILLGGGLEFVGIVVFLELSTGGFTTVYFALLSHMLFMELKFDIDQRYN
mgnify:CR=1 FL=1